MEKLMINTLDCPDGYAIADDVFNSNCSLIITKNMVVNEYFIRNISQYYVGSRVMLNTDKFGEVVYVPPHDISSPVVRVEDSFIDLSTQKDMRIAKML